jgi:hypothetical protein
MYRYTVAFNIKQPKQSTLKFETIKIGEVHLRLTEGGITAGTELEANTDEEALGEAMIRLERTIYALTLTSGIPFTWDEPRITSRQTSDAKAQEVRLYARAFLESASFSWSQEVTETYIKVVETAVGKLQATSNEDYGYLKRLHHWWQRALWDEDPIDRFVDLYVCCEIIGEKYHATETLTRRVQMILRQHAADLGGDDKAETITGLRSALLHFGKEEDEVKAWNPKLAALVKQEMDKFVA